MDDHEVMLLFAERVAQARDKRGWSQQRLAEEARTTYQTIWRIEKGSHKDVGMLLVRRLAQALGVGVDRLIGTYEDSSRRAGSDQGGTECATGKTKTTLEREVLQGV